MMCLPRHALWLLAVSVFVGCSNSGSGPALYEVSGEVVVDGQPLENGSITFEPVDGKGGVYGDQIQNGRYTVQVASGEKRVSILASRPSKALGPDGNPMSEQYIPASYNTKSQLTASVVADAQNEVDFTLDVGK
ncbi:hypothetical protein Poly24_25430 [Rosistilla carotiformis]|uniref:Carboxypeptidase regulatory-like domain-containing protein n=1 Tax=Rosistilla carotiformis TaxID=2528017 RepID=A0A518JTG3_9BACT|nr:hypothetical protein [Rosistilla carotiformis]QDV68830.1 hypothetical protein Poly24_25430 [Rosistilla carotiformis]